MDKMKWEELAPPACVWANEWITIQDRYVQLPTGVKAHFYAMEAADSVAVLALDDQRCAILNRQYRPALGKVIVELPSGQVNRDEKFTLAAHREFAEETGLNLKKRGIKYLGSFYRNPARDTGATHIYFGRVGTNGVSKQEKYECMETIRIPWDELINQVLANEILDINTSFAVLMLQARIVRGEIQL